MLIIPIRAKLYFYDRIDFNVDPARTNFDVNVC